MEQVDVEWAESGKNGCAPAASDIVGLTRVKWQSTRIRMQWNSFRCAPQDVCGVVKWPPMASVERIQIFFEKKLFSAWLDKRGACGVAIFSHQENFLKWLTGHWCGVGSFTDNCLVFHWFNFGLDVEADTFPLTTCCVAIVGCCAHCEWMGGRTFISINSCSTVSEVC